MFSCRNKKNIHNLVGKQILSGAMVTPFQIYTKFDPRPFDITCELWGGRGLGGGQGIRKKYQQFVACRFCM